MEFGLMKKRKERAFGKDVFLLGKNKYGELLWLESPSWDCDWYWGFGYVETYSNNTKPQISKDISCHTHWDTLHKENDYVFVSTTFNEVEYQKLKLLFNQFYGNNEIARKAHKTNIELWEYTNEVAIPGITKEIISILNPENN